MVTVKPFQAYRPKKGMESTIAALPYDVYNRAEAKEVVLKNPKSFLAIDRAETSFDDSVDTYDPRVYAKAAEMLKNAMDTGDFVQDEKPMYYIYALTMKGRCQHGIVACASIDDYVNGIIKKHENTREDKEIDRIHHVDTCSAQTGPIFLTYRSNDRLKAVTDKVIATAAEADFTSEDGIRHQVWKIEDAADIEEVTGAFGGMDALYIADGHHRCASAVKVGLKRRAEDPAPSPEKEYNYFLSVIFPEEELKILDYNRVVRDLNGHTPDQVLEEIEKNFYVKYCSDFKIAPRQKGQFSCCVDHKWYLYQIMEDRIPNDPVKSLDVSLLQDYVLEPVFGIKDPRTDSRIDFVGGIRGVGELEKRCRADGKVAFAMYPTSITELLDVADAGMLMPPKSTWFEPKLRSGLFVHVI
ncbi:MAG: DUF1015 family protein [Lachnospiraceae bacterium]|nr:DUF1015 family protein [Lachnospiraceae bacterium]